MEGSKPRAVPGAADRLANAAASVALAALLVAVAGGCGAVASSATEDASQGLAVRRGGLEPRLLLTGELHARQAYDLVVPRSPSFQLQIRWMEEDGAEVRVGQRVVELDNSQFASDLEDKKLQEAEAESELARKVAEAAGQEAEKRFDVEKRQEELTKAEIDAAVPPELISARELQDRKRAVEEARAALEKARSDLEAAKKGARADLEMKRIEISKKRREITLAEEALRSMVLTAPAAGVLVLGDHPWEGRKLQVGDTVWVGVTVARIPDLSTLAVKAMLSDVDDGKISVGMPVVCTLDAYPDLRFPGHVSSVAAVAQEARGASLLRYFDVAVDLDRVDTDRMRPGMSVKVEVERGGEKGVLLAPRAALDLASEPPRARLASGGWAAVRLGACDARSCVVLDGLDEGDRLAAAAPGEGA